MDYKEKKIYDEIISWKGKRWIHGQALKSQGADCIQLIVAIAKNLKWIPQSYKTIKYNKDWAIYNDKSILLEELKKHAVQVPIPEIKIGDIVVFISGKCSGHAGIYIGNNSIVHSHIRHGITEESLDKYKDKLESVWRIKS